MSIIYSKSIVESFIVSSKSTFRENKKIDNSEFLIIGINIKAYAVSAEIKDILNNITAIGAPIGLITKSGGLNLR